MKQCIGCKHAKWNRTSNGRLHPSGEGRCTYPWVMNPLPAAFYMLSPHINGGGIDRKREVKNAPLCTLYEVSVSDDVVIGSVGDDE